MSKRIKMTVELDVTIPQAVALTAMFKHWNHLSSIGSTRAISFLVDGDGNFHPNAVCSTSEVIPEVTEELAELSRIEGDVGKRSKDDYIYDFDGVAYHLGSKG